MCMPPPKKALGKLRLADNTPHSAPAIDPNFLDQQEDLDRMIARLQISIDVMESKAFDNIRGDMPYLLDRNAVTTY